MRPALFRAKVQVRALISADFSLPEHPRETGAKPAEIRALATPQTGPTRTRIERTTSSPIKVFARSRTAVSR